MNEPIQAPVIAVSRHRIQTDGQGVTTLVCFHGCPLRCRYCLNPFSFEEDTAYTQMTPLELYQQVQVDELYFLATEGGVTFGGGEPLLRADFIKEFRRICGKEWRLAIETSLAVPMEKVRLLADCVDEWIIDIKDTDPAVYRRYTGQDNAIVMKNLRLLSALVPAERIRLRLPLIPQFNTEEGRQKSKERLSAMGFTQFDCFTYKI